MVSCSDSSTNSGKLDQPPQVPSGKTMMVDMSIFTSERPDSNSALDRENYERAAESIDQIQTIMKRNVMLSINLFENADTSDAEEIDEGQWQWTYDAKAGGGDKPSLNYEIRLVASQAENDQLEWKLFLSSPALPSGNQELRVLEGISNREVTQGTWTYFMARPEQPEREVAELEWEIDEDNDIDMGLKLHVGNLSGSAMNYETEGAIRTIKLNPDDSQETTIEFNTDTHEGFIEAPDYNSGEKACWDSNFEDASCGEVNF